MDEQKMTAEEAAEAWRKEAVVRANQAAFQREMNFDIARRMATARDQMEHWERRFRRAAWLAGILWVVAIAEAVMLWR